MRRKTRENYAMHLYQPCTFFFLFIRYILALDYGHALCWHTEIQAVTVANIPDHQPKKNRKKKKKDRKIRGTKNFLSVQYIKLLYICSCSRTQIYTCPPIPPFSLTQTKFYFKHLYFLKKLFWGYAGACRGAEEKKALLHLALPQTLTWSWLKVHQRLWTLPSALQGLLRSHQICRIPTQRKQTEKLPRVMVLLQYKNTSWQKGRRKHMLF